MAYYFAVCTQNCGAKGLLSAKEARRHSELSIMRFMKVRNLEQDNVVEKVTYKTMQEGFVGLRSIYQYMTELKYAQNINEKYKDDHLDSCRHTAERLNEVVNLLRPTKESKIIDMTFGVGGHSRRLVGLSKGIRVFCLDRDPAAYSYAKKVANLYPKQIFPLLGRFSELPTLLREHNITENSFDGIMFDFGCSPLQIASVKRGFSVNNDGPLDMRMDGLRFPEKQTAADILATSSKQKLYEIFNPYLADKLADKIATNIVMLRNQFPITTTWGLVDFVSAEAQEYFKEEFVVTTDTNNTKHDRFNKVCETVNRVFRALCSFVNDELNEIENGLSIAYRYLKVGGRIITLCYDSLEEDIVLQHIKTRNREVVTSKLYKYCDYSYSKSMEEVPSNWRSLNTLDSVRFYPMIHGSIKIK